LAAAVLVAALAHLGAYLLLPLAVEVGAVHQFGTIRLRHFRGHSLIRLAARVQLPHLALRQQRLYPQLGGQRVMAGAVPLLAVQAAQDQVEL
jgi:hypothetical protein